MTSAAILKLKDEYDLPVAKDEANKLYQHSLARLRQIGAVSYQKIGEKLGEIIDTKVRADIDNAMLEMLITGK